MIYNKNFYVIAFYFIFISIIEFFSSIILFACDVKEYFFLTSIINIYNIFLLIFIMRFFSKYKFNAKFLGILIIASLINLIPIIGFMFYLFLDYKFLENYLNDSESNVIKPTLFEEEVKINNKVFQKLVISGIICIIISKLSVIFTAIDFSGLDFVFVMFMIIIIICFFCISLIFLIVNTLQLIIKYKNKKFVILKSLVLNLFILIISILICFLDTFYINLA